MKEELALKIKDMATPIAENLGLELVEIKFTKEYGKLNLNMFIYKKEGIAHVDCENLDTALTASLDEIADEIEGDYILNISSLGLDRLIVTDDDLRRSLDTEIEVFLKNEKGVVRGKLLSYDRENITIAVNNKGQIKKTNILKQDIFKAQPWIKF